MGMNIRKTITECRYFTKLLPLVVGLSGCTLIPEHDPIAQYTLSPPRNISLEAKGSPASLLIDTPKADASLNTQRIAVSKTGYRRDYFAESQWTDKLPRIVQDILVQTFQDADKFKGVGRTGSGILSDYMLQSDLRDFAAHYDGTGEAPKVRINAHVRMMDMKDRRIESSKIFTLERQAPENNLDSIIMTFNEQVQSLALEILEWTLEESQSRSIVSLSIEDSESAGTAVKDPPDIILLPDPEKNEA